MFEVCELFFLIRHYLIPLMLDHYLLGIMMFQDCKMKRLLHSKLCSIDHFFIVAVQIIIIIMIIKQEGLLLSNFFRGVFTLQQGVRNYALK